MASLSSCVVPLEIIDLILDKFLDSCEYRVLRSCRLVCKTFEGLATPHAFRVLILSDNKDSRAAFSNIVENSQLARLVKTINFIYQDLEHEPDEPELCTWDYRDDEEMRNISNIFSNLPRLPNLKKLLCDFPGEYQACDAMNCATSRCLSLQMRMFEKFGECYSTSACKEGNGCSITTANPRGIGEDSDTALQIQNKSQLRSIELKGMVAVAHHEGKGLRSTGLGLPAFFQSV